MKKESQVAATYLSEYSDTVEALPLELQRNYTLIRQLDENAEDLMQQVATEAKILSNSTARKLSMEERRAKLESIGQLLNEALKKGEEKFALAKSTYDTVDRHCTRLDNDLQKIEDEQLIGPGRVSAAHSPNTPTTTAHKRYGSTTSAAIATAAAASTTHKRKRRDSSLLTTDALPKTGRKKQKKDTKSKSEDTYLSTEDAIQHAKAAANNSDLPIDPNEPLYCYCSQVSFGEMVACDNDECEIEWFHLECAGLKTPPKGKWYCRHCSPDLKKRKKI